MPKRRREKTFLKKKNNNKLQEVIRNKSEVGILRDGYLYHRGRMRWWERWIQHPCKDPNMFSDHWNHSCQTSCRLFFSSLYNSDASHWHHKVLLSAAGATSAATLYVNNVADHFFYWRTVSFEEKKLLWHKRNMFCIFLHPRQEIKGGKMERAFMRAINLLLFIPACCILLCLLALHPCSGPCRQKQHTIFLHNWKNIQRYHQSRVHVG